MGVSFRRLIANLKRNNYSASISRTDGLLNFKFQDTFKKQLKTKAKVKNRTLLSHWPTTTLDIDDSIRGHRRWRGEKGRGGSLATSPPPQQRKGGQCTNVLVPKNHFYGCIWHPIDITCDIGDFLQIAHFLPSDDSTTTLRSTTKQDHLNNWLMHWANQSCDCDDLKEVFLCSRTTQSLSGGWAPFPRFKTLRRLWKAKEVLKATLRRLLVNTLWMNSYLSLEWRLANNEEWCTGEYCNWKSTQKALITVLTGKIKPPLHKKILEISIKPSPWFKMVIELSGM